MMRLTQGGFSFLEVVLALILVTGTVLSLLHQQLWLTQQLNAQIHAVAMNVAQENQREQIV